MNPIQKRAPARSVQLEAVYLEALLYLLFAFDYMKLSLRLLQGSCFTQTDVNYCFISFLDDDSCARKTGKNKAYKHNWVTLFTNSYSYFDANVFYELFFRWNETREKKLVKTRFLHQNSELGLCSWCFVTKIVPTYCEKKNVLVIEKNV